MKYIRTPKPKRERSHIPVRLNILFFFVFLLLAALVAQLAYLQIMNGAKFRADVDSTDSAVVTGAVPRGQIYDAEGRLLVANSANSAIVYTKSVGVSAATMRKTADELAKYVAIDQDGMRKRDYADYFLADKATEQAVIAKLPKALQTTKDTAKQYRAEIAYAQRHLPDYSDREKAAATFYKKMNAASQLTTVYLKDRDVTQDEVAQVGEHLTAMAGINLGTDWDRAYPDGKSMLSIIGTVSSEKTGLPAETLNEYLAKGYARNDRVGTSYLEKEYEDVLKGAKSRTEVGIGNNNNIVSQTTLFKGQQGANLNLTINSEFQKRVDRDVQKVFNQARSAGETAVSDGAYAVAMNPHTGAILAISGLHQDVKTHQITNDSLGVLNRAFAMGSIVKPAMVLGALQDGVITVDNNSQADTAIYLRGAPVKKSDYGINTFSSLTATKAIEVSSNTYMMHLAMKEANAAYAPNAYLRMNKDIFTKMRGYFRQFGLGQKTGVDLPGEIAGMEGQEYNEDGIFQPGSALDLSYGNLDTYTLIQAIQYVSTLANNGYRMEPYIVKNVSQTLSNGSAGPVLETTTPTVLSKIKNNQAQINLVKQGMWQVVHGTSGYATGTALQALNPGVAGKTGTAQTFTPNPTNPNGKPIEGITQSFVGYAPAANPQVAIAVVVPNVARMSSYAYDIAKLIFQDYYALYKVPAQKNYDAKASSPR
ncbi:peptidoglycan D,D-transpeptidase FtsI family protein [Lacticaseibacillus jixianensis]|uniref:Peptidoglycan D,D-transpeptidase FtsI family protein n=1 Tax=Lacticaseibacillus jixianensis TaxID=2486012 RepID=A0ABW4BC96_9LACO|nr:penicillin-binding protein 2 [Lacticaseibacillus jixianensis]